MIDKKTVEKVAKLARLELTEKELEKYSKDLQSILKAFGDLSKVNTKNVEPAFQPIEVKNITREDRVEESLSQKEALDSVKNREKGFFKGPKVV